MGLDPEIDATDDKQTMLSAYEARVIACLMEKELTVPDTYPLSLNALTLACNQKSNREPKMQLTEGEVGHVAKELEQKGWLRIEYGERVHRFEHTMRKVLEIDKRQQSLLTVLMLRAPQTLNDLKLRTKRMVEFENIDEILQTLESLNRSGEPMMLDIPKGPGQREDRYTHLLCGEVDVSRPDAVPAFTPEVEDDRLAMMQKEIDALVARIERLESKLN